MAKAAQKRLQKELDKLQRAGRYIDWLAEVQDQPITPQRKREMDTAWQEVQRRTLRTKQTFDEFLSRIDTMHTLPQTPEMQFLLLLRDLINGRADTGDEICAVTGLSTAYQAAQKNLRAIIQLPRDWQGIEKLLAFIASDPGKVSRKHYHALAAHCSDTILHTAFLALGNEMVVFRRLNHKANLHKSLSPSLLDDLYYASQRLWQAIDFMPPVLRRLCLLPLVFQVLLFLRQATPAPAAHQVLDLFQSVELTFAAGADRFLTPELRTLLEADGDDLTSADLAAITQKFTVATFEEKLALVRDLRQAFHRHAAMDMNDNPFMPSFIDDEMDEMQRMLLRFYKQVFKEIGRRSAHLAPRERRALVAVFDPIVARDVDDLFTLEEIGQRLVDLLLQAAEAGCMGIRLSMLGLIVSRRDSSKLLGSLATKALQEAPNPGLEDLRWIVEEHGSLVTRTPEIIRALFDKVRGVDDLVRSLGQLLWEEVKSTVLFNAFAPGVSTVMRRFGIQETPFDALPPAVIRELAELAGQVPELEPMRRFLAIFSEGRISAESLRQWFEDAWIRADACALFIETTKELFALASQSSGLIDILEHAGRGAFAATANTLNFKIVLIAFLKDHADDFRQLPLETAHILVEEIFPVLADGSDYGSLLIKTYNAFCSRVSDGDKACIPLRDALDNELRKKAGVDRGRGRSTRR